MIVPKNWNDLKPIQKVGVIVMATLQLLLLGAALFDLSRRPKEEVRGDKRMWIAISFVNFVGPISYFLFGRMRNEKNIVILEEIEI